MIDFNVPANNTEALAILRAMRNFKLANEGGAALLLAEVFGVIGVNHLLYTSAYCVSAQKRDGLWQGMDFTKGTPFWLEDMATGKMIPITGMIEGAKQLMAALH